MLEEEADDELDDEEDELEESEVDLVEDPVESLEDFVESVLFESLDEPLLAVLEDFESERESLR
ncbi:hypothetical protein HUW46_05333 [Amycolatopsis sp. CA-230715]|nr:hypothetical protein HUW46_05333 [Amycolatopsis sp. CA-230715]